MKVLIRNEDLLFIKSFYSRRYPRKTHILGLNAFFDYYNMLCIQFLKKKTKLTSPVIPIASEYDKIIKNYINKGLDIDNDLSIYYQMLILAIQILNIYYQEDGTLKLEYIKRPKRYMRR